MPTFLSKVGEESEGEGSTDFPDSGYSAGLTKGKYTVNLVPFPNSLSTAILPPCSSTIFLQMYKPSPRPSFREDVLSTR